MAPWHFEQGEGRALPSQHDTPICPWPRTAPRDGAVSFGGATWDRM